MKNKDYNLYKDKKGVMIFWIFLIASVMICYFPYLWDGIYEGLDSGYHLARIDSLSDMLKNGVFPVKLHTTLCYGFGYGTGFFYPNFFLYFPALLVAFGVNLEVAAKFLFFVTMVATFISSFYCTWKLTKHIYASALVGSLMTLSPLMINTIFHIFALGHVTAMPFIPLCIVGLYLVLEKEDSPWMFIVGFWGLILTHTITLFLTFAVCILITLFYFKKLFKSVETIKKLFFSVIIVTGTSVSYWLPMLEQYCVQQYKISTPWTNVEDNIPGVEVFFASNFGPGIFISASLIFILGYLFFEMVIGKKIEKIDFILTGLSVILSYIVISNWFWNTFQKLINFVQFPYRLFYLVTVLVILELGMILSRAKIKQKWTFILVICIIFVNIGIIGYSYSEVFQGKREFFVNRKLTDEVRGVGTGEEWLPVDCSGANFVDGNKAISNDGSGADGSKEAGSSIFNVYVELNKEYYDMPYVYYFGYQALLTEEDGSTTELMVQKSVDQDGKVRVFLPENKEGIGKITVSYQKTLLQKISYITSALFYLLILYFVGRNIFTIHLKEKIKGMKTNEN